MSHLVSLLGFTMSTGVNDGFQCGQGTGWKFVMVAYIYCDYGYQFLKCGEVFCLPQVLKAGQPNTYYKLLY